MLLLGYNAVIYRRCNVIRETGNEMGGCTIEIILSQKSFFRIILMS